MTKNGGKRVVTARAALPRIAGALCAALFLTLLMTFLTSCGDDDLAIGGGIIIPTLPPDAATPTP